jgi:D-lactate dehydrogenase
MKLAFFDAQDYDKEWLSSSLPEVDKIVEEGGLSAEAVGGYQDTYEVDIVSVFVTSKVDKEVLDKYPQLKMIATRSTGFDHIDMEECKRRGIIVANVPSYGENTVAEHAFALILALARKIFQSYERTERLSFDRDGLQGFDLKGKKLGVVGTGKIGCHSIRIGSAFGMEVIAYDAYPNEERAKEMGYTYVDSLDELLAQADVVTLHVPYMPETHHMINKDNIKKIKKGAILVNTARGALVDTEALLLALEDGILSGAGLDVLEGEDETFEDVAVMSRGFRGNADLKTLLRNHILIARDDVIITPHNAFNSIEAVRRIFDTTIKNIDDFVRGDMKNEVQAGGK